MVIRRCLSLAGVGFDVTVTGPCDPFRVDARFANYYVSPEALGDRPVSLAVHIDPAWVRPPDITVPYPGVESSRDATGALRFRRNSEVTEYDTVARVGITRSRPSVSGLEPEGDPTPLEPPLRMLLAYELARRDGLLMHASGWSDHRGALVFLAVSGGGKTTTAKKLPHVGVLSDDQVALRFEGDTVTAHALPFVGEYRRATGSRSGPLRAVVLLSKGDVARSERVSTAEALAGIARCVVSFVRGDPSTRAVLDRVAILASCVPVYRWTLPWSASVEAMVHEVLG